MDKNIKIKEQGHLSRVISRLKNAKVSLSKNMEKVGAETLEKLKEFRESPESSDFYQFLEQVDERDAAFNFKDKYKKLEELGFLIKDPYFSRIDLFDPKRRDARKIYIGKFGHSEEEKPLIIDWRTRVASVYYRYRYPQKSVFYETPAGKETRDLLLKRTFEIDDGEVVKYYNNDLQLDESEIIIEKIKKRTGGVLEDIVETIQESQLDIIESDPRQICIVQGCVGSGKSTVAIHKLAHIFFNYPKLIRPEKSILIAKSQILVGYLSTLFPKLGIFDITYKTVKDLVVNFLYREEIDLDFDLSLNTDLSQFTLGNKKKLDTELDKVHEDFESRINDFFSKEEFEPFGGFKYSKNYTVYENLTEIIKDMEEELSMQKDSLAENPNSTRAWFHKENIKTLRKIINKMQDMRSELKHMVLTKILKNQRILPGIKLGYKETFIYCYIYSELIGFSKSTKYEYCVVDEGQDFSILEYLVMSKFVLRGRFAIFGDLNQSLVEGCISTWKDIPNIIKEARTARFFELETNYRSTKPIIELANAIMSPYTKNYLPKSINRVGLSPAIETFESKEEMLKKFNGELTKDVRELNKSIGIICFSKQVFEEALSIVNKKRIKKHHIIKLDSKSKISYIPNGVYIMNFEDCKGLEFSKVYILDKCLTNVRNFKEAKEVFVAATRAMNEVCIYGINKENQKVLYQK